MESTSQPEITVYSNPGCQPCLATKRQLDKLGLAYGEASAADSPQMVNLVRSLGLPEEAPIVVAKRVVDGSQRQEIWTGFRPDRLRSLAA
ncbi:MULTISPECIES: glutaredoxin domain-containing protein [unclassified Cellulosimicrobium]|uniref:Glutaredoxin domain-containing protein n=1 Tax=Cellulosimicrobium sp. ES-005 TaxID=3163031 RepID=A0AAU8FZE1_9MICO|nr:glutaredoxin domain-containing protein [Cellulosimicrobium sp. TH-20]